MSSDGVGRRGLLATLAAATGGCLGGGDSHRETERIGTTTPDTRNPTPPADGDLERPGRTADESLLYTSSAQLRAIRSRAAAGTEPWHSAARRLVGMAEKTLNREPLSVTDDGAPRWDDPHQFGHEESKHDYTAARKMTAWVRDTALAYRLTGADRFARGAIDLIAHWCLDEDTRMKPVAQNVWAGPEIALWITIPDLWYGATLVGAHPYWDERADRSAFREWTRAFVDSISDPGYFQYNNIWAWRIATLAAAGEFLNDDALFDRAVEMWRAERNWRDYQRQATGRGALKKELRREDGLGYQVYAIKALSMTAEIARNRGIDLYGYTAPTDPGEGSTLRKLFRFVAPYLSSPDTWQWGIGGNGLRGWELQSYASVFELAYSRWQADQFREAVRVGGRPTYDGRLLGPTTLTHGELFRLDSA